MSNSGLRISIPRTSTLSDAESKYTSFTVVVETSISTWEVQRRYKQFASFNATLLSQKSPLCAVLPVFPKKKVMGLLQQTFVEERREALEAYLNQVIRLPHALTSKPIIDFLQSETAQNLSIHLQMVSMGSQLANCQSLCSNLKEQLIRSNEEIRKYTSTIDFMNGRINALENIINGNGNNGSGMMQATPAKIGSSKVDVDTTPHSESSWSGVTNDSEISDQNKSGELSELKIRTGHDEASSSMNKSDIVNPIPMSPKPGYFIKQMLNLDKDLNHQSHQEGSNGRNSQEFFDDSSLRGSTDYWSSGSTHSFADLRDLDDDLDDDHEYQGDNLPESESKQRQQSTGSEIIPSVLLASGNDEVWERLIDEVVTMISPQESQVQYRLSASRYVGKCTRKILGAQVYEIGLQGLRCFLPDDPIRMSTFLCRGFESGWFVRLNEQMCRLSGGGNSNNNSSSSTDNTDTDTNSQHQAHALSNISFVNNNENNGHKLQCLVDNVLGVEVLANVRLELCLMAFFEDFDRLFGKDHLFKRSILLIRAWWVYESNVSTSCGISDFPFCILILSIVNRFHKQIHHPFHALSFFLAEYSTLDFEKQIITINGPVAKEKFLQEKNNSENDNLISADFLNRYRKLTLAIDEDESSTMELLSETIGDSSFSDAAYVSNRLLNKSNYIQTVCEYSPKPFIIAHPLLPGMIFDMPTAVLQRKKDSIVEAFRDGARALLPILSADLNSVNSGSINAHQMIEKFYKNVTARFGRGWRPDMPPLVGQSQSADQGILRTPSTSASNRVRSSSRGSQDHRLVTLSNDSSGSGPYASVETMSYALDKNDLTEEINIDDVFWISLDKLWEKVRYCNLILESQISESALRILSRQILYEKGALPVGEIGKMLQEACSGISNMSLVLKERFGGLKKFLESYPDDFVLANDHPFNPNVHLKDSLSIEELGMIMRGESLTRLSQGSSSSSKVKKNQRGGHATSNRTSIGRKKSPAPTMQLSQDIQQGMHVPIPYSRTFSSDSLSRRASSGNLSSRNNSMSGQYTMHNGNGNNGNNGNGNNNGIGNGNNNGNNGNGNNNNVPSSASLTQSIDEGSMLSTIQQRNHQQRNSMSSASDLDLGHFSQLGLMGMPDPMAPEFKPRVSGSSFGIGEPLNGQTRRRSSGGSQSHNNF